MWPALGIAADPPEKWEKDIQKFEKADLKDPPNEGGILFVGSSSIRKWDAKTSFPDLEIINRGFGGSQISDLLFYYDRVIARYKPRTLVLYAGDNDVNKGKTAQQVFLDYRQLMARVARDLPETDVVFIAIKPSIKRWDKWPVMNQANSHIKRFNNFNPRWHYADIATPMLGEEGQPRPEIFAEDELHLNEAGYELWAQVLKPFLK